MKKNLLIVLFLNILKIIFSQTTCITGGMSVYDLCNNGQGCTNNCDLTEFSWFGNMCNGTSVAGNCFGASSSGGQQTLSTTFTVPSSCTSTISARFSPRCNTNGCVSCGTNCAYSGSGAGSGCGNSGIDGGDKLIIGGDATSPAYTNSINISGSPSTATTTNASGYTLTATGGGNSGVILQYAQTGGTMFVGMSANRSDEIVTFTLQIQSGCSCANVLPVDIYSFIAIPENGLVKLQWFTKNELHLSHYKIEKSTDGIDFDLLSTTPSENSITEKVYTAIDDNPHIGISYYKLTPVNKSGFDENYIIRDVLYQLEYKPFTYFIQDEDVVFHFQNFEQIPTSFALADLNGKKIFSIPEITMNEYKMNIDNLPKGIYIGYIHNRYNTYAFKVIIM